MSKKKKGRTGVIHLIHSLEVGGAESLVYSYAKLHDRSRYRLGVCTFKPGGRFAGEIFKLGVDIHCLESATSNPASFFKLIRILRQQGYEIVHFHNPLPVFWGLPATFFSPAKVRVLTEHNIKYPGRLGKGALLYSQLRKAMDVVLACSDAVRKSHLGEIEPDRFIVVHNGVDPEKFRPGVPNAKLRSELDIPDGVHVIGNVASLSPQKGQAVLLDALQILVSIDIPTVLIVVGDGDLRASLESKAERLGVEKHVRFLGLRNDVPELLRVMDIAVFSSLWEGLPVSILEAMATGTAVVATKVGGNPEVVIDGVTGLLVPPKDHVSLALAVQKLLMNREVREGMGIAARELVMNKFTLKHMIARTEEIYEELVERKTKGRQEPSSL